MKINIENSQVLSEDFTKHICVVVLNHYIELEKQIIENNKNDEGVAERILLRASQKSLKHLQESKKYIQTYYKQ
jgi:hypothetical protein